MNMEARKTKKGKKTYVELLKDDEVVVALGGNRADRAVCVLVPFDSEGEINVRRVGLRSDLNRATVEAHRMEQDKYEMVTRLVMPDGKPFMRGNAEQWSEANRVGTHHKVKTLVRPGREHQVVTIKQEEEV